MLTMVVSGVPNVAEGSSVSEIDDEHAAVKVASDTRAMRGAFEVMNSIVAHIDAQMSSHLDAERHLLFVYAPNSALEDAAIHPWQTAQSFRSSARGGSRVGIPR